MIGGLTGRMAVAQPPSRSTAASIDNGMTRDGFIGQPSDLPTARRPLSVRRRNVIMESFRIRTSC